MKPRVKTDQKKNELPLPELLLQELHLLTRDKKLNADAARKLKQIAHLFGFIEPALNELFEKHDNPQILEVGSGKSYLGFLIYEKFLKNKTKGHLTSFESRPELVDRSQKLASDLNFSRMIFSAGMALDENKKNSTVWDCVVALHACDTATDEAIEIGLTKNAKYFFLVPCCQAELARSLPEIQTVRGLEQLFRHPLHNREFGSLLTNVIRALFLESKGYKVRVTEFVGWEHSQKNELIIAEKIQGKNSKAQKELEDLLKFFPVKMGLLERF